MTVFFAWVDSTETTFGVEHHVEDEDIFSFDLLHEEGQIPTLQVTVRNPRVGLLNASRKQWCWLSYSDDVTVTPLFFGRLVGIPGDMFEELVKLTFLSRSNEHIALKQTLADSLAVRPYWDPVFLDDKSRRDADAIIEGRAASYHVDRLTLAWTISSIASGEDGTVVFTEDDVIYETLAVSIGDTPIKSIRCTTRVSWTQVFQPAPIPVGSWTVKTYTGGGLIQQWPKGGTSLGGGWYAAMGSNAVDVLGTANATVSSLNGSFSDTNHEHNEGDCISGSWSTSSPSCQGLLINFQNSADYGSIGDMGGDTGKGFGDGIVSGAPQGSNRDDTSCSVHASWSVIALWKVAASLLLTFDPSENPFTETATLTIGADLQNILADADTQEEVETLEFDCDVGEPLLDYRVRSSLDSTAVAIGQIVLPNEPSGPGGVSFQICVQAGTTAASPPAYSDTVGYLTTDGTAIFACVGAGLPSVGSWSETTYYRIGALIVDNRVNGICDYGAFYVCVQNGYSGASMPSFGAVVGPALPPFNIPSSFTRPPVGAYTNDGSVVWYSLGAGGPSISIPVGGAPGAITANNYFGQSRGHWSVEYMIKKASARVLTRARCIEIGWTTSFEKGFNLSCRKSATVYDSRLPGGVATGKIVAYRLSADGNTGEFKTDIKIGCMVGSGGSVAANDGTPTYIDAEYIGNDYQQYDGVVTALTDVGYTPPHPDPNYSGYSYPITLDQVLVSQGWVGDLATQQRYIGGAFGSKSSGASSSQPGVTAFATQSKAAATAIQTAVDSANKAVSERLGSIYYTLSLRPITGIVNETPYTVETTPLVVPKHIDLEAASVS